jgi:hypothetical protein
MLPPINWCIEYLVSFISTEVQFQIYIGLLPNLNFLPLTGLWLHIISDLAFE